MIACKVCWRRADKTLGQTKLYRAQTYWLRLRGLLGRPAPAPDQALEIRPCSSVHTFFMGYAIDVVYLDAQGVVIKLVPNLTPWRISFCPGAACVIEFAAGAAQKLSLQVGDQCEYC